MTEPIESEWRNPEDEGITLSVEESIALWHFFQREDVAPHWEDPTIDSIAQKAKSFHKYGPWEQNTETGRDK